MWISRRQWNVLLHQFALTRVQLSSMENHIMSALDDLIAKGKATLDQVTKNTDLDTSIIAIVNAQAAQLADLRKQLDAAGTDADKLAELGTVMDQLAAKATAEGQATADAVTANTPADTPKPAGTGA